MRAPRAHPAPALLAALLLGAAAVAGCQCGGEKKPAPAAGLADLVVAEGTVTLTRDGKAEPAKVPLALVKGDALATGEKSRAVLRFKGGREVELGEKARFVIGEGAGEITLEITEGLVLSRVAAGGLAGGGGGMTLAILTPGGITRVPADGEANVSVGAGGTTIEVHTGEITFVGKDGQSRTVKGGEKVEVSLGEVRIVRGPDPGAAPDAGAPADAGAVAVQLDAFLVTLSAERGVVQVKGAADARFRAVGKNGEALAEGTAFKLAPGSKGALAGGGLKVRLGGGSDGSMGKVARDADGAESFEVGLNRGNAQVIFDRPGKRVVRLAGPAGPAEVEGDGEATLAWARDAKTARLDVQAGKVQLRYAGKTHELQAGDSARLAKEAAVSTRRTPPALSLPAGRRIRVFANDLREVALTWPAAEGARLVEVAGEASFKDPLLSGVPTGTQIVAPAPAVGDLFWRVRGAGDEALSKGRASFAAEKVVAMVGGFPVNEVAETGLKATVYYQSVLPALVFSFPAVEGAARYRVRLYKSDDLGKALLDKTVAERRCPAEPGKLGEGSYLWNATPLGQAGNELAGGRMNKLDIVYDNATVSLTIQEPAPGPLPAGGATVRTRGVAPMGSKLFVNGKAAELDAQGRFELAVPRAGALVYRLVDADGSESYWLRGTAGR